MFDFETWPVLGLVGAFGVAAIVVWVFGTRLASDVSALADRFGISGAAAGLLVLGPITSLPEIATAGTAAYNADAALAANSIFGSVSLQVVVIAVADLAIGKDALTSRIPSPGLMAQATMSVILLLIAAAAITVGDQVILGAGAWTWLILLLYLSTPFLAAAADRRKAPSKTDTAEGSTTERSDWMLFASVGVSAAAILIAGYLLSTLGEVLSDTSGLGASFFGLLFIGLSTSLPELSSAIAAARLKRMDMAAADVLGGNLVDVALLFMVDAIYRQSPVLGELGAFSVLGALLGAVLTLIFMMGMIERRNKSILRMGYDSVAIFIVAGLGMALLYQLR